MRDEILTNHLRQWLEANPSRGLEKLVESEMDSLVERLGEIVLDVYSRGWSDGYADCQEDIREGAYELFGVKI
jgi:hypothetical protein